MKTIIITPYTTRTPMRVTGAALRSVQAAVQEADRVIDQSVMSSSTLIGFLNCEPSEIDATWCACAWRAIYGWRSDKLKLDALTGRYKMWVESTQAWPCCGNVYCNPVEAVVIAAEVYHTALTDAGIPMDPLKIAHNDMSAYWKDAAARGC